MQTVQSELDYTETQSRLVLMARWANELDLDSFLERINHCETVAPLIDPTLYLRAADKLRQVKELAEAAREFQKVVRAQILEETNR